MKSKVRIVIFIVIGIYAADVIRFYLSTAEPHILWVGKKHSELSDVEVSESSCFWLSND